MLDARIYLPQEAINRFELPKASIRSCERLLTYLNNKGILESNSISINELLKVISRSKILEFSSNRLLISNGDDFFVSPVLLSYIDLSDQEDQIERSDARDPTTPAPEKKNDNVVPIKSHIQAASALAGGMSLSSECNNRLEKTKELAPMFELNRKELQFSSLKKNFGLSDEELIDKLLNSPYLGNVFALDELWLYKKLEQVRENSEPRHANS
jgi:hypothetical protein